VPLRRGALAGVSMGTGSLRHRSARAWYRQRYRSLSPATSARAAYPSAVSTLKLRSSFPLTNSPRSLLPNHCERDGERRREGTGGGSLETTPGDERRGGPTTERGAARRRVTTSASATAPLRTCPGSCSRPHASNPRPSYVR